MRLYEAALRILRQTHTWIDTVERNGAAVYQWVWGLRGPVLKKFVCRVLLDSFWRGHAGELDENAACIEVVDGGCSIEKLSSTVSQLV